MRITLFLVLLIAFGGDIAYGQQIRKITGVRTYFYPSGDSIPPTVIDSNFVLEYDRNGRLLRDQDIEGVCYQLFRYDEKGRNIADNSYCGEGFKECKSVYSGSLRIDSCYSALNFYLTIDSLNEKGLPVKSDCRITESPNDPTDTTLIHYRYFYYYEYDAAGRETYQCLTDSTGAIQSIVHHTYNESGQLISYLSRYPFSVMEDSTVYTYDDQKRVVHARKFCYPDKNNQFRVIHDLQITYPEKSISNSLNITFVNLNLPYFTYDFEIHFPLAPAEIKYTVTDQYSSDGYLGKNVTFTYSYDKKGKLIQIIGSGTHGQGLPYTFNLTASYLKANKATVVYHEDNSSGFPVTGDMYEYENGLLKKISEKDKTGFIHATTVYSYDFFK